MINQGLLEVAFHEQSHLKLTALSNKVLFEKEPVLLAKVTEKQTPATVKMQKTKKATENNLFERLRGLRLRLSKEEGIPAYQIFNDASLREMEQQRPMTDEEFMQISGVGRKKMQDYGFSFISEIIAFNKEKRTPKQSKKEPTYLTSSKMFAQGMSVEDIAMERKIADTTILSHLCTAFEKGEDVHLESLIDEHDLNALEKAKKQVEDPSKLRSFYQHFKEEMPYSIIKIGLAILDKKLNA